MNQQQINFDDLDFFSNDANNFPDESATALIPPTVAAAIDAPFLPDNIIDGDGDYDDHDDDHDVNNQNDSRLGYFNTIDDHQEYEQESEQEGEQELEQDDVEGNGSLLNIIEDDQSSFNNNNNNNDNTLQYNFKDSISLILLNDTSIKAIRRVILTKALMGEEEDGNDDEEVSISTAIETGHMENQPGMSFKTFRDYTYIINRFLTFSTINNLSIQQRETCFKYIKHRHKSRISVKTIHHEFDVICKYVYTLDNRPRWVGSGIRYIIHNKFDNQSLTLDEVQGILSDLYNAQKLDLFLFCSLCVGAGLRPVEAIGLSRGQIKALLLGKLMAIKSAKSRQIDDVYMMKMFRVPKTNAIQESGPHNPPPESSSGGGDMVTESGEVGMMNQTIMTRPSIEETASVFIDGKSVPIGTVAYKIIVNGMVPETQVYRLPGDITPDDLFFNKTYESYRKVYNRIRTNYMKRHNKSGSGVRDEKANMHYGSGFRELRKTFATLINDSPSLQSQPYERRQRMLQLALRHRGGPHTARIYVSHPSRLIHSQLFNL
jgi:integrase